MPAGDPRILIDGRESACVDARDRGLAYGDGLFETLAVIRGIPSLWQGHMARLATGCERLGLPIPVEDRLREEIERLAQGGNGVAKLILTRGIGPRGYVMPEPATPCRILQFHADPALPHAPDRPSVRTVLCRTPLGLNPLLAGLKHLNRLEQVMARREWHDPAIAEGLLCDAEGFVVEGIASNLFLIRGGRMLTPLLDRCGVAGVMRACVMEAAAELGLEVEEGRVTREALFAADGLLLTNSIWGIRLIEAVGDARFETASVVDPRLLNAVWRKAFWSER